MLSSKKRDKHRCGRTRYIVFFIPHILLPYQNLAPTLPTMQQCVILVGDNVASVWQAHFFVTHHPQILFIFRLVVFSHNRHRLKWHHLIFIRLHAAPSADTKGFINVSHTCSSTPQHLETHFDVENQWSSSLTDRKQARHSMLVIVQFIVFKVSNLPVSICCLWGFLISMKSIKCSPSHRANSSYQLSLMLTHHVILIWVMSLFTNCEAFTNTFILFVFHHKYCYMCKRSIIRLWPIITEWLYITLIKMFT